MCSLVYPRRTRHARDGCGNGGQTNRVCSCDNTRNHARGDLEVRNDAIIATGRSDYPNQVNNVLGFPYISVERSMFEPAILQNMKMAATRSLAELAKEPVPDYISAAYDGATMEYGWYIIQRLIVEFSFGRRLPSLSCCRRRIASVTRKFSLQSYREDLKPAWA